MSAEPTAKPKRARRSIEQQIAELDCKRRREAARAEARHALDAVREHMIARCHYLALEPARALVAALEKTAALDADIEDGEFVKAAQ